MPKKPFFVPAAALSILLFVASATCAPAPKAKAPASAPATKAAKVVDFWDQMSAPPNPAAAPQPQWIWGKDDAKPGEERFFRVTFDAKLPTTFMTENPSSAWIWCAADDETTVYLNGKVVARSGGWSHAVVTDVRSLLRPGKNVIAARCRNDV